MNRQAEPLQQTNGPQVDAPIIVWVLAPLLRRLDCKDVLHIQHAFLQNSK